MTDNTTIRQTPSITLLEQAKFISERLARNRKEVVAITCSLDLKSQKLSNLLKERAKMTEDIERLTNETAELADRKAKVTAWLAKNGDSQEDADKVAALAEKIKRLRHNMEIEMRKLREMEIEMQKELK